MLSDVFEVLAWGYCPGSLRVAGGAAATATFAAATTTVAVATTTVAVMILQGFWFVL
jgi:hypothetical protein